MGPFGVKSLFFNLRQSALITPKSKSAFARMQLASSTLFLPDRTRAIVKCGLKPFGSAAKPKPCSLGSNWLNMLRSWSAPSFMPTQHTRG
jgi:hypothetical protein